MRWVGLLDDGNSYLLLQSLDIEVFGGTAADQTIAEVYRFGAMLLQSLGFRHYLVSLTSAATTTCFESHELDRLVTLKAAGLVTHGRKTAPPSAIQALFLAANNPYLQLALLPRWLRHDIRNILTRQALRTGSIPW